MTGRSVAPGRIRTGLLVALLFLLPLLVSTTSKYQYAKVIFALVVISLLLALWAIGILGKGEANLRVPLPLIMGLLLLLIALLSLLNSRNPLISLESFGLLLFYMLLYLLLANAVSTERQLQWLLGALLLAGALAALYALIQYFGFDLLPHPRRLSPTEARNMISTMGNRNYLAGFLSYLFLPALALFFRVQRWKRLLIFISLAIIFTAILASGTRAAWLGLVVAGLFLIIATVCFRLLSLFKQNPRWIIALVSMLLLIAALFTFPTPLSERTNIPQQIASGARVLGGPYVRYQDWWIAWEMIKAHPLLGIGLGGYKLEFFNYNAKFLQTSRGQRYKDVELPKAYQAHNDYLQTWAELGTLGLLVGLGLITLIFYSSLRNLQRLRMPEIRSRKRRAAIEEEVQGRRFTILSLQAGIVVLLIHALFSFPFHLPASMLELVVFTALLESGYLAGQPALELRLRSSRIAFSAVLLLLAMVMSTFTLRDLAAELYLQKGERLLSAGAMPQATAELERSLRLDFAPQMVLFDLGLVYMDTDLNKAEQFFLRSLNSSIVSQASYLNLVEIARAQKDYHKALKYAEQGMKINPANLEFPYLKALIYAGMGETAKSIELLEGLIQAQDGYYRAKACAKLGQLFRLEGFKEKATESYHQALREIEAELKALQQWQGKRVSPEQYQRVMGRYQELKELYQEVLDALKWLKG